jgi:predicted GNAT superfamily acetyltransferase
MTDTERVASMDRVTDVQAVRTGPLAASDAATAAAETAASAAVAAGVIVRDIADLGEFEAVRRLYDGIWRPVPDNQPVTTELLRALTKAGNYVAGAYDGSQLVGACVGFFGAPADRAMHSHIAGVSAAALGRNVGFALKLHQRAWAMQRGISVIRWTFDPLVGRNAYFNLVKLGTVATEYLPNFYGGMHDGINASDQTDRLLVRWDLDAPAVAAACAGNPSPRTADAERARGAVVGVGRSADGLPVPGTLDGDTILVAVPHDIAALRAADPALAGQWRFAVRDALAPLLRAGAEVAGFDRSGWYIVVRGAGR